MDTGVFFLFVANILAGILAVLHFGFFVLETFEWTKPTGRKVFRMSEEQANATAVLAKNQGVYNLLLAIGLLLSATGFLGALVLQLYLFAFVAAVGIYGAFTVNRRIFFVQALPGLLGLSAGIGVLAS